jgi:hypothetical protein
MQLSPQRFAAVNAVLVLFWLVLAWQVGKIYMQRTAPAPAPVPVPAPAAA